MPADAKGNTAEDHQLDAGALHAIEAARCVGAQALRIDSTVLNVDVKREI